MKRMRNILVMILALSMMVMLAACGSSGGSSGGGADQEATAEKATADENGIPYGVYVGVAAEMMGVQMGMDEILGEGESFSIELKENNKVEVIAGTDKGSGKYSVEGDQITISVGSEEMTGTYSENAITVEDMMGMGVTIHFGLEGTDAADPANYISDEAAAYVGTWVSTSVTDILDEPVDLPDDALQLTFEKDMTVSGTFNGEAIGPFDWDTILGLDIVSEDPSFLISENDDGTLSVSYSSGDDYFVFEMSKQ